MKKLTGEIAVCRFEEIEAGMIGVAYTPEKNTIEQCTVIGLNRENEWLFEGETTNGTFNENVLFCAMVIQSNEDSYSLKQSQWKRAIQGMLSGKSDVTFSLQPLRFTPGNYHHECNKCGMDFIAHKKQHTCSECCISHGYAVIDYINKKSTLTSYKGALPPIAEKFTASVARKAYEMGRQCVKKEEFEKWLKKVV